MNDYILQRVLDIAKYIVEQQTTVRQTAAVFGVSKSTVHKDMTERLPAINPTLAEQIKDILDYNKSVRHIRGGEATKKKYQGEEDN